MKKWIKREWINALQSGEYKQGNTYLRDLDDRYCCLGVLCEIARKNGVFSHWAKDSTSFVAVDAMTRNEQTLPTVVSTWSGLKSISPYTEKTQLAREILQQSGELSKIEPAGQILHSPIYLTSLNDAGVSFDTIARIIKACF